MAMSLNLTLVVQMANFLFGYFLLSKYLLKPAYEAVKSDAEKLHQLTSLIVQEQKKLAEKQEYKRKRWQRCQDYFYRNRPDIEKSELGGRIEKSIELSPTLSAQELENKARHISAALKEKVLHD